MNEINHMFIKEHEALNSLFKEYVAEKDDQRKIIIMGDIQRKLFAHFAEEELYYSKYNAKIKETILTLKRLISEHGLMADLIMQPDPDIPEFIKFLVLHEHIEEKTIYPELEKNISQEDVEELLKKLLRLDRLG